jgi:NAD(P)-dependent dehydrogenase (short-subunit alcohol dehydrogenase family)
VKKEQQIALVTNASDYAGPPAVAALLDAGFRVLVHDDSFVDDIAWEHFSNAHDGAERVSANSVELLVEAAWAVTGRIDAILSVTTTFPLSIGPPLTHHWTTYGRR